MKGVDIRKIYICQIAEQADENSKPQTHSSWRDSYPPRTNPTWDYVGEVKYGLFIKVLHGFGFAYKHIITGEIYLEPDTSTGGKIVIIPESIEKLTFAETKLCTQLVAKYASYVMDISVIRELEEKFNSDAKFSEEKE